MQRSAPATVTKPHGDFDSVKREQDYCALCVAVEAKVRKVGDVRGASSKEKGGRNAMHVWEVVLAEFEINDLNMCCSLGFIRNF